MKCSFQLSKLRVSVFLLVLFSLFSLSCRKVGKEATKKAITVIATTLFIMAVEELAAAELTK
jgi:hypothetical protein